MLAACVSMRPASCALQVGTNMRVTPGEPFAAQPSVLLLDAAGRPVANATAVAFATEHLNFFQEWVSEAAKTSRSDGAQLHHTRGQNYALLEGVVSSVTGPDGVASWSNLTLTAASSRFLYLMFFCDGAVASWNDPELVAPFP